MLTQKNVAFLDPYTLDMPLLTKLQGRYTTYRALKKIERTFMDFKSFYVDTQFREIYSDLQIAFKRRDLVVLQRSLSDPMYEVSLDIAKRVIELQGNTKASEFREPVQQGDLPGPFDASPSIDWGGPIRAAYAEVRFQTRQGPPIHGLQPTSDR
jgi:hypothetical protein